jgi:chaperonin GroES
VGSKETGNEDPEMAKEKELSVKLRPLDDRVVVLPLEADDKSSGGILLPDTAREKPQKGRVLAVGPGKVQDKGERTPVAVSVGDVVLFGRYAGNEIQVDNEEIKIMRESDLLAKIV